LFEAATEVFADPAAVFSDNYNVGDEQRYQVIGINWRSCSSSLSIEASRTSK
jgi:uncharacterized DUF497 family protein